MTTHDTAGNVIAPPFLYPCPVKCSLTAGCKHCRQRKEKEVVEFFRGKKIKLKTISVFYPKLL